MIVKTDVEVLRKIMFNITTNESYYVSYKFISGDSIRNFTQFNFSLGRHCTRCTKWTLLSNPYVTKYVSLLKLLQSAQYWNVCKLL